MSWATSPVDLGRCSSDGDGIGTGGFSDLGDGYGDTAHNSNGSGQGQGTGYGRFNGEGYGHGTGNAWGNNAEFSGRRPTRVVIFQGQGLYRAVLAVALPPLIQIQP